MKRHILLIAALCFSLGAMSDVRVSAEEAMNVAAEYYQLVRKDAKGESKAGTPEKFSLLGMADMWLVPVNDCWILVSTDKRVEAILARFNTQEKPNLKSYPPAAQYLISCYEHDIAFVRDSCEKCPTKECWEKQPQKMVSQTNQAKSYPSSVEPLLGNNMWAQFGPQTVTCECAYNRFCPQINTSIPDLCGRAAVGCIAVAMAEIMWYWKWPYIASVPTTSGGSTNEIHFYDWDLMPAYIDNITPVQKAEMIATLLRDCGYSVNMMYGEESTALDTKVIDAMTTFSYDANTMTLRSKWDTPGWTDILHSEIAAGRPVYYSGRTIAVKGHAFVLDGYDAAGRYHVNWGHGWPYNDYYYIDTVTVNGSCYSHTQHAIWGIQPDPTSFCSAVTIPSMFSAFSTFGIARAGTVTLDGVTLNSNANWRVYSSTSIQLLPGTEIRQGATALFDIKDVPCSSAPNSMNVAPLIHENDNNPFAEQSAQENATSLFVLPNPVKDILRVSCNSDLEEIRIYNLNGSLVLTSLNPTINVSHLQEGLYIIHAKSTDGQLLQTKFIHQCL